MYDAPAQLVAFRMCTNDAGKEYVLANNTITKLSSFCTNSTAYPRAMLIVSIGKRLVADAIQQNVSKAANGPTITKDIATITNLRKIYSFTVGRLGWQYTNLSDIFHAKCDVNGSICRGLELPLRTPLGSSTQVNNGVEQRLIVGENAVLHAQRNLLAIGSRINYDKTSLVAMAEPPELSNASDFYRSLSGDLLLPHNIRNITWNHNYRSPDCDAEAERRVVTLRTEHMYMEDSLQAAYTAGTYYLFQSAVVRDNITLSSDRKSLAFQRNSQAVDVWVSTPSQNMWLTLGGCFILIAGLVGTVIKSQWFTRTDEDALAHITEPHAIARVMMNERRYPPLFLHRHVVEKDHVADVMSLPLWPCHYNNKNKNTRRRMDDIMAWRQCEDHYLILIV